MPDDSANLLERTSQGPHPLALRLRDALVARGSGDGRVLVLGAGSGRNLAPFLDAGLPVTVVDDNPARLEQLRCRFQATPNLRLVSSAYTQLPGAADEFAAVLATHALLHGTRAKIRSVFAELMRIMRPGAPLYITLGSIHDARYGIGHAVDISSFAPIEGDEIGVPHVYFEEEGVRDLLRGFQIETLEEVAADALVGRWAHGDDNAGRMHWLVVARKPT